MCDVVNLLAQNNSWLYNEWCHQEYRLLINNHHP